MFGMVSKRKYEELLEENRNLRGELSKIRLAAKKGFGGLRELAKVDTSFSWLDYKPTKAEIAAFKKEISDKRKKERAEKLKIIAEKKLFAKKAKEAREKERAEKAKIREKKQLERKAKNQKNVKETILPVKEVKKRKEKVASEQPVIPESLTILD